MVLRYFVLRFMICNKKNVARPKQLAGSGGMETCFAAPPPCETRFN